MPKGDPWEGIDEERRELAKSIFKAARQVADEDGDGDGEPDLSAAPPALKAVGSGFNRLVRRAYNGELDENDPKDMVDALRMASATLVDSRQPPQYQGFKWMSGGKELMPSDRFGFGQPQAPGGGGWQLTGEDQQRLAEMGYDPRTGQRTTGTTTIPKNVNPGWTAPPGRWTTPPSVPQGAVPPPTSGGWMLSPEDEAEIARRTGKGEGGWETTVKPAPRGASRTPEAAPVQPPADFNPPDIIVHGQKLEIPEKLRKAWVGPF